MSLQLPYEILLRIATIHLELIPRKPLSFLLTSRAFSDIAQCILHEDLRFLSIQQMSAMLECNRLAYYPRTFTVNLAGGASDFRVFGLLHRLLLHVINIMPSKQTRPLQRQLLLQRVQLCLNSYMLDPNLEYVFKALSLLKWVWTLFVKPNLCTN